MKNNKKIIFLFILFISLIILILFSMLLGSIKISIKEGIDFILGSKKNSQDVNIIILNIRITRIIFSIIIGGLLAMTGLILQSILKNPLADPYITGISSGAAFGATIGILFNFNNIIFPAILGAFFTIFIIYKLSNVNNKISINSLILIGVMVGAFLSSLILLLSSIFNKDLIKVFFWLFGDLAGIDYFHLKVAIIYLILFLGLAFLFSYDLNLLTMEEEIAITTGTNIEFIKIFYFVLTSVTVAFCVSLSGIIGFVGLIIPHIMRYFLGPDLRWLLPACLLSGGIFLLLSDTIARICFLPQEIPVGIITGIIGAPFFILILIKGQQK